MNMFKLFSFFVLLIGAFALIDEQTVDSSLVIFDEISHDEETGMELKDDQFDVEDEMLQDENAISDISNDNRLHKRQTFLCQLVQVACRALCRRITRDKPDLLGPCLAVCNFPSQFSTEPPCISSCNTIIPGIRFIQSACVRVCRFCLPP